MVGAAWIGCSTSVRHSTAPVSERDALTAALAARAGRPLHYLRQLATGATLIDAGADLDEAALERFAARLNAGRPSGVAYIEPDRRMYPVLTPNDPMLSSLWGVAGPAQAFGQEAGLCRFSRPVDAFEADEGCVFRGW